LGAKVESFFRVAQKKVTTIWVYASIVDETKNTKAPGSNGASGFHDKKLQGSDSKMWLNFF